MKIELPELSLVALIGTTGSGKSTFAKAHFKPTEVLSSDHCRALVSDDENDQGATGNAFDVLYYIAAKRLTAGRLTVIDATNVQAEARKPIVKLAQEHDVLPVAIVLNLPDKLCHERNRERASRQFGPHVISQQSRQLQKSLRSLKREGFRHIAVLNSPEEVAAVEIVRKPLWNNRRHETGPFDIIGDVHGCFDETVCLLRKLGYDVNDDEAAPMAEHPKGRRAIFLGDLIDRGPKSPAVLRLVMAMVRQGSALCVPGNHDIKLHRKLDGREVRLAHGLAETMEQLDREPIDFVEEVKHFIHGLVSHYVLDGGKLVIAHAGMKEAFQGRASARVRDFALFGESTGETDEYGLPVRYNWAVDYRGQARVVYGHTPVPGAEWLNNTICIDTGCVFGGVLTALRYPENELVSVAAAKMYYKPIKPIEEDSARPADRPYNDVLDIADVQGKRIISTRIRGTVTVREENAAAALEVMGRFATDPRWLIYLPPTMSPSETRKDGPALEHPEECFQYFHANGVPKVVCQEKHMGSRAIAVVCRDEDVAAKRFGIRGHGIGALYTRTGRPFFDDPAIASEFLDRLRMAFTNADFWKKFASDWFCLDAELMPWSAKAQELLQFQYAPVGAASRASMTAALAALRQAASRTGGMDGLIERYTARQECVEKYTDAYRRYCWPVTSIDGLKFAPFHLLASEGCVHASHDHIWHMNTLAELCDADGKILHKTAFKVVDLTNTESQADGIAWWEALTGRGGEGMVVKPVDWLMHGKKGLVQPALKCRGKEYLRIIYGPEYTLDEHIERLRARSLGPKRSLALREFALGLEALHRFVEKEPLYRVHECVFGVLALESEPVDPRL
ncbi:MAG: polynucleotide kinase-phosphatase [Candidatus Hydrogenedentes bacterium]|nr:polynucleotide kinase-phosphatase [Candidatus Hydrogenedentota bacterium]